MHFAQHSQIIVHGDTSLKACLEGDLHSAHKWGEPSRVWDHRDGFGCKCACGVVTLPWPPEHPALVCGAGHPSLAIQS